MIPTIFAQAERPFHHHKGLSASSPAIPDRAFALEEFHRPSSRIDGYGVVDVGERILAEYQQIR